MKKRFETINGICGDIIKDNQTDKEYTEFDADDLVDLLNEQNEKIKELESQVAKWKQDYENCSKLEKIISKERQYCLDNWRESEEEIKQLKQSQNSKAIEVLENVKEYCENWKQYADYYTYVLLEETCGVRTVISLCEFIDSQITELRGEENDN